jgi:phage-related protein
MAEKILLDISLQTKQAQQSLSKLEKSFDLVKAAAGAAVAAFAGAKLLGALEKGIDAAVKQQNAVAQLGQQLKLTGEFSQGAVKGFEAFADEMERTTKFGDDLILNQLAIAKSFGISNDKAKELVKAATELSAATGKDLEGSVRQLGLTFSGVTGKLDEQIPALKNLTKAQLESGAALKIITDRFGGSASAELQTFSGALTQTGNAFDNLLESLGALIVENPAFIMLIKEAGNALNLVTGFIADNADSIKSFMNQGIALMLEGFAKLAPISKILVSNLQTVFEALTLVAGAVIETLSAIAKFEVVQAVVKSFGIGLSVVVGTIVDGLGILYAGLQGVFELIGIKAPEAVVDFAALSLTIEEMGKKLFDANISETLDLGAKSLAEFSVKGTATFKSIGDGIDASASKLKSLSKEISNSPISVAPMSGGPGAGGGPSGASSYTQGSQGVQGPPAPAKPAAAKQEKSLGMSIGAAVTQGIAGGADGAGKFLSAAAGGIADAFVPGMGQIVGPLVDILGQGPDAVKGMVNGFVDALPDLLDNIIDAIPVLISAIADRIPDLIVAIVNAIPRIVVALIKAFSNPQLYLGIVRGLLEAFLNGLNFNMSKIAASFTQVFSKIAEFDKKIRENIIGFFKKAFENFQNFDKKLRESIANGIKNAFSGLKEAFGKAMDLNNRFKAAVDGFIKGLVDKAGDFIDELVSKIKGGKGGGGFIGQVTRGGKKLGGDVSGGFKEGLGYGLTGGTGAASLDLGGGAELEDVVGLLFQVLQELRKPMEVKAEAKVNDKVLADIILNLNRRNARLTA